MRVFEALLYLALGAIFGLLLAISSKLGDIRYDVHRMRSCDSICVRTP